MVIAIRERELFSRLNSVINKPHKLPKLGTGAAGLLLEQLLGIENNPYDQPDAGGWEIKYHGGTALLTLFHKNPKPGVKALIDQHGWQGRDGRQAFRKTLTGSNDEFTVVDDGSNLIVRSEKVSVQWSHDDIINAAASKLRRLVVVSGKIQNGKVVYNGAKAFSDFVITKFIPATIEGMVRIDFDARYQNGKRNSDAIRDHGTKFRISLNDLPNLYRHTKIVAP